MTSFLLLGLTLLAAPPGAADIATRLGVASDAITSVKPVVLNGQTLGHLVRFTREKATYGVLISAQGPRVSLGVVDAFDTRGIIDLGGKGRLPMVRSRPGHLEVKRMADPAWVLITRRTEPASDTPKRKGRARNRAATQETLHLIRLPSLERVLQVPTQRRSTDGYGGHDIKGLTLTRMHGVLEITGVRQDKLPAHKARCLRPPPVPVRYVMENGAFQEVDARPPVGCGRRQRMPGPLKLKR